LPAAVRTWAALPPPAPLPMMQTSKGSVRLRSPRTSSGDDQVLEHLGAGRDRTGHQDAARELVRVGRRHGMVGALVVAVLGAREDRVAERLVVALEAEHPPAAEPVVAAVFGRREAALERMLDEEVDEGHAAAPIACESHRRRPGVEEGEERILLGGREPHERLPVHFARGLVHLAERLAIDGAETRERPEEGVVEVGAGDLRGAEELRPPADLLHARQGDEVPEGVLRPSARGRAVVVVGEGVAVAEWPAGEDERHAVVEGGQHALDVVGGAQRARPGVVVGGDHPVAERREGRELMPGEEAAARPRVRPPRAGDRRRQRGEHDPEALQELAPAEEQCGRGLRLGRERRGRPRKRARELELRHRRLYPRQLARRQGFRTDAGHRLPRRPRRWSSPCAWCCTRRRKALTRGCGPVAR